MMPRLSAALLALGLAAILPTAPLTLTVPRPAPVPAETFHMGTATAPDGSTLKVDARSLLLNGKPWTPVMGEFHYSRYPAAEWPEELRKLKAGGIDIVATYVFWIHHEEVEGEWVWTGDKHLAAFVRAAADAGLKVIVRCGPWCHGEVRNGGLPDWIVARGQTRTEDPAFLAATSKLYAQIAAQLRGLLWKDGGPVIGIQLDNEYGGPAEYLLALKNIARDAGLDVPLYTRTGWPALKTPMPFGEIVPLYGVYAEGFWDRELTSMPGQYWAGFHFSTLRTDANIANEALGRRDAQDAPDVARYPYLTCEIGGGMMSSYHRRILVDPRDIESTTLVKLGSGSISPGYYMYHGGTNPEGRTTLMEEQSTPITNWNDMPVKNYDFQTALGQYGQTRPQYQLIRRLAHFLHDFGGQLPAMPTVLPDARPAGKDDISTLRWAVRSDGRRGFVFLNNYERSRPLPDKPGVQFSLTLPDAGRLTFPDTPITIPANTIALWPFNLDLGGGGNLVWATAQPVCVTGHGADTTWYFAETPGVPAAFAFTGARVIAQRGRTEVRGDGLTRALDVTPGREPALILNSSIRVVLLSAADSLALVRDGDAVRYESLPALNPTAVPFEAVRPAGPLRQIRPGLCQQPVAAAPLDADFAAAAVWRIRVPAEALAGDHLLRIHYTGDVARVSINGRFINDDYYNGNALELGLRRHAAELKAANNELTIAILPLQKDAPIFLPESAKPAFADRAAIAELRSVDYVPRQ